LRMLAFMYMICNMKAIQVTMDEGLLLALDAEEEVQRDGRSAVLRRAVADYLRRRRGQRIDEQYRRAYARGSADPELEGWGEEEVWPEK
jgi:metal-responsive CopG/Arc/MetJ family transcriptional regulator